MKIQGRLFLGTALLVLSLTVVQWWLHVRQLRAIEQQLTEVAAVVSRELLGGDLQFFVQQLDSDHEVLGAGLSAESGFASTAGHPARQRKAGDGSGDVRIVMMGEADEGAPVRRRVERVMTGLPETADTPGEAGGVGSRGRPARVMNLQVDRRRVDGLTVQRIEAEGERACSHLDSVVKLKVDVVQGEVRSERFLVLSTMEGFQTRIPIPVSPTVAVVRSTMNKGLAVGGGLLVVGLVASGVLARRLARPLQHLAKRAEDVGSGDLGIQVEESAGGEVGELQRAFNHMSRRLAELEEERETWRQREHLAQLGDLSRGLAHTLRNPLNTLGLAIDELSAEGEDHGHLAATARSQIRRIDRWLRSFLALGAEGAAEPERTRVDELVQVVALEAMQQDVDVRLDVRDQDLRVWVVRSALAAALGNLVANASEASPPGASVDITVQRAGSEAQIEIADRGPGMPGEVRERLFSPHVTTKTGGSGMGLFLARQLIVGMHGGGLQVEEREGGGTVIRVRLPVGGSAGGTRDMEDGHHAI